MTTSLTATVDWHEHARCAQLDDPSCFYPDATGPGSSNAAKAICADCPVTMQCLTWALEHDERYGVWGGLSESERQQLRKTPSPQPLSRCQRCDSPLRQTSPSRLRAYCTDACRKAAYEQRKRTA